MENYKKKVKIELYNDHFENAKRYGIPHAQLIIADIPYNLGNNAYASNPQWYIDGDNKNGESKNWICPNQKEYFQCSGCGKVCKSYQKTSGRAGD